MSLDAKSAENGRALKSTAMPELQRQFPRATTISLGCLSFGNQHGVRADLCRNSTRRAYGFEKPILWLLNWVLCLRKIIQSNTLAPSEHRIWIGSWGRAANEGGHETPLLSHVARSVWRRALNWRERGRQAFHIAIRARLFRMRVQSGTCNTEEKLQFVTVTHS